jgi:hypothetical protein
MDFDITACVGIAAVARELAPLSMVRFFQLKCGKKLCEILFSHALPK